MMTHIAFGFFGRFSYLYRENHIRRAILRKTEYSVDL